MSGGRFPRRLLLRRKGASGGERYSKARRVRFKSRGWIFCAATDPVLAAAGKPLHVHGFPLPVLEWLLAPD